MIKKKPDYPILKVWSLYVNDNPGDCGDDPVKIVYNWRTDPTYGYETVCEGYVDSVYRLVSDPDLWLVRVRSDNRFDESFNETTTYMVRMSDCKAQSCQKHYDGRQEPNHVPCEFDLERFEDREPSVREFLEAFSRRVLEWSMHCNAFRQDYPNSPEESLDVPYMGDWETEEPEPDQDSDESLGNDTENNKDLEYRLREMYINNPEKDRRWWV